MLTDDRVFVKSEKYSIMQHRVRNNSRQHDISPIFCVPSKKLLKFRLHVYYMFVVKTER